MINMNSPSVQKRQKQNNNGYNRKKKVSIDHIPFRFPEVPLRAIVIIIGLCIRFIVSIVTGRPIIGLIVFFATGLLPQVFVLFVSAIPVGQTLMAVRKGKRTWEINIRHFAFWRLARLHQKPTPLLFQIVSDFKEAADLFPPGTEMIATTWLLGKRAIKRFLNAGYHVEQTEIGRCKLADLWIMWSIAQLFMEDRRTNPFKAESPFADKQFYHLTKAI